MKFSPYLFVLVILLGIVSCESNKTEITESGLPVNFVIRGDSSLFNENDVVLLNMHYLHQNGDTMFNTLKNGMPLPLMYNKEKWDTEGLFYEAIELCGIGDSLTFSISAYELFINTFKSPVPDSIVGSDMLNFTVGIENVMTNEEFVVLRDAKNLQFEAEVIDKYLNDNNLTGDKTENGLTYIMIQQGQGENAQSGDSVFVKYRGAFLDDREFDSGEFNFVLGAGNVIKGWDQGLTLLNPGSKATLLIPSSLGYGERGRRPTIPPNTILKFDVELLGIKKN